MPRIERPNRRFRIIDRLSTRGFPRLAPIAMLALLMLGHSAAMAQARPESVTGIYQGNDGGFYYVRFAGDARGGRIFWFGEGPNGQFSNVMAGPLSTFSGVDTFSVDNGEWWDVPKAGVAGAGSLSRPETLLDLLLGGGVIRKSNASGVTFGGSEWRKLGSRPPRVGIRFRAGFSGEGATGVWVGPDGGVYYVRQIGSKLVWFGEVCSETSSTPTSGNVFIGDIVGRTARGSWVDVPYGTNNNVGTLALSLERDRLVATEGFSGQWIRSSALAGAGVAALTITITTGGDDLRGGAVAYGMVELRGGRTLPRVNLNGGGGWGGNSVHTVSIPLPLGTRLGDLVSFTLEHDGAPRNIFETYDNWNVDAVQIRAMTTSPSAVCIASPVGGPFVRLTGEKTFERIPISLP